MNEKQGYICLWRKFVDTSFFTDLPAAHLAVYLLLTANHQDKRIIWNKQEMIIKRGSLLTGRNALSVATGIPPSTIRNKLEVLKNVGFLDIKSDSKFSLLTIVNYDSYQNNSKKKDRTLDSRRTAEGQQKDTNNNDNNEKNDNIIISNPKSAIEKLCFLERVMLTQSEYDTLEKELGKDKLLLYLNKLNNYIKSTGKRYKSHYHVILNWRIRDKERQGKL